MAISNDSFTKYTEKRAKAGYGTAICVRKPGETLYSLLIASENVPSIFGSVNTVEFDLLNSPTSGKIETRFTLDDKETECLYTRDNAYRFEQLKGVICDFLVVYPDMSGKKFTGTVKFKPNDAGTDVLKATYTITPMSADEGTIMDCRPLLQETIMITNTVPMDVVVDHTSGVEIPIECDVDGFSTETKFLDNDGKPVAKYTTSEISPATGKTGKLKISGTSATAEDYAMAYITVKKEGYAPWTITVALVGNNA